MLEPDSSMKRDNAAPTAKSIADQATADAFANSWNNLPSGSVYTREQAEDWFEPLRPADMTGKRVLELGCGNASLLVHVSGWGPAFVEGVDLGGSVTSARENMSATGRSNWRITKADMTTFESDGYDVVYSIGVLHHLKDPKSGFDAVVRNVRPGGRFHCWVYAREGNAVVRYFVDPIRKVASKLPWWFTKYLIATPLVSIYFVYAKALSLFGDRPALRWLPLYDYSRWIAKREFAFFRHVAFDQLVTPQTVYLDKTTLEGWLQSDPRLEQGSTYVRFRNGNSWKFGGRTSQTQS